MASSSSRPLAILGIWLLVTLSVAFLFLGGVAAEAQAGLHLLVAIGCGMAISLPARKLEHCGVTLRWLGAGALLLLAIGVGLLPVPESVAAVVAPGTLMARPGAGWSSLATRPGAVPAELATWTLTIGFGAAVATWGASRHRRAETELALLAVTGLLATSALAHALVGATTMLGLVSPVDAPSLFLAPFVNPDHAAAMMLLGGPVAVGILVSEEHAPVVRGIAGAVALAGLGVIVWGGSTGAAVAAGVVAILWTLRTRGVGLVALVLVVGAAVAMEGWVAHSASWVTGSAEVRARLWHDALRMASDYWLAGTGGGTFGDAIRGYRTDHLLLRFSHAHSEPIEWLAETGVVGVLAAGIALFVLARGGLREPRRAHGLAFGLLALGLHACVDFPTQIPGIAMAAAGVLACLVGVFGPQLPASAPAVRMALAAVGVLQLLGAGIQLRESVIRPAIHEVLEVSPNPAMAANAVAELESMHAGAAERLLYAARSAEAAHDQAAASAAATAVRDDYPDLPDVASEAALVFARAGQFDVATAMLERVTHRLPSEYRAWVLLARIAHAQGDDQLAARRYSEAFHRGAPPPLDEAYSVWPLGLYWLDAFGDADPSYSAQLGHKLAIEGDLEVALLACEQAERLDPVNYSDLLVRASILQRLGRPQDAEAWLRPILARQPDNPVALTAYASVLGVLGRHDDAVTIWLSAARFDPMARIQALRSAEASGGPGKALELAGRFEVAGTVDGPLGIEIAALHLRDGDPTGCRVTIDRWGLLRGPMHDRAENQLKQCRAAE